MSINLIPAFPFSNIKDERLYRLHKLYAESYVTNLRNFEAPWKPVITSVLEAIVKKVHQELSPSVDITVQQEQPLAPPALAAASVDAQTTMTTSRHKGTVYPDISVLRYLVDANTDFRTLTRHDMGHKEVDYLVCAELKRSIKRAHIRQGLNREDEGYQALSASLRGAASQAVRQAFIALNRPGQANSDVILIAAAGPFWIWCLASRDQLLGNFPDQDVEDVLDDAQEMREEDIFFEQYCEPEVDNGSFAPISSALLSPMSKKEVMQGGLVALPWSDVVMLDTEKSEIELRALLGILITIVRQR